MPLMSPEQARALNEAARFYPQNQSAPGIHHDGTLPCIEIGGVQVYVYADPHRGLRISVHFDTAEAPLLDTTTECVPVEFDADGISPIWRADASGIETYPRLAEHAHAAIKAVCDLGDALGVTL